MVARLVRRSLGVALLIVLVLTPTIASALEISEFRLRGPNGANDEFIEVYNETGANLTVAGGGTGYAIAASNGVARCVIPNGTVIPNRGHWLCVNSVGYSLASYPAGNGSTATGDATYTSDIPDNAGIALFNTSVAANFTLANRLDAVGSASEANTLYKEGTGYPTLTSFSIDDAFYRDLRPNGAPQDTNNNAADFVFVDTNGTSAGAGQRLGAPGPQNLSSAIAGSTGVDVGLLDPAAAVNAPPNLVRDFTSDPAKNSTFGTLDIRRTITNNTGASLTRLRFRVRDITTFPSPSGVADLRLRTSTAVAVMVTGGNVTVQGTTLDQPPAQPNGGGFGSSVSAATVTLAAPLANGASISLRFLIGIQQTGSFRFCANAEGLPAAGGVADFFGATDATDPFSCALGPETTITDGPANGSSTTDDTPTFSFSSPPTPSATFECAIDAGAYAVCASPLTTGSLSAGTHTFKVRAKDAMGVLDATPATRTFSLTGVAPDTAIDSGPADGATVTAADQAFAFSSGAAAATFECALDAGTFAVCTSPRTLTALSAGMHTFRVRAVSGGIVDATPATRTFTVDLTPAATMTAAPTSTTTPATTANPTPTAATGTPTATPGAAPMPTAAPAGLRPVFGVESVKRKGKTRIRIDLVSTGGTVAVSGTARIKGTSLVAGSASFTVGSGSQTVAVKLPKKVRTARAAKLTYTLTFTPTGGGTPIVKTRKVTIKRG